MQLIKSKSELSKYRQSWESKLIEGMKFNHDDHLSGNLSFPCYVSSYLLTNITGLYTFNHIYFTPENAKTLLNQYNKKIRANNNKKIQKMLDNDELSQNIIWNEPIKFRVK